MRAYLPKSFERDAKRQRVSDHDCQEAIRKAESGLIDADLGGGLIKQRIPRSGQGAARGLRTVIFYKRGEVAVFLHVFAKSDKANLTTVELVEYKELVRGLEKLTETKLKELGAEKGWRELEI
ncbi:MAG: type II toxin-antitoxin system RelE/ParE family toxin [Roseiarcus sp.]